MKANLEKENEDVFEDASIADSYNIKDDDNVIRVDIIPNDGKSKEEPAKEKQDSPAVQENNVTVRSESTKPSVPDKGKEPSKNLPVKSNTEIQLNDK